MDDLVSLGIGIVLGVLRSSIVMPEWFAKWQKHALANNNAGFVMKDFYFDNQAKRWIGKE
mgnify:CR=1 FL=1